MPIVNTEHHTTVLGPTLAYDAELNPSLRGVIVKAPGTLVFRDVNGKLGSLTFAAADPTATGPTPSCDFPARVDIQIGTIVGDGAGAVGNGTTGTDIALANLLPLA